MAHIEFDFVPVHLSGDVVEMPVSLDCWRATLLFISLKDQPVTLDGIPWNFLYVSGTDTSNPGRIELGGLVVDNRPVNIKHVLHFSTDPNTPFQCLVVRQYFIP